MDEVVEGAVGNAVGDLDSGVVLEPGVLHGLGGGGALLRIVGQQLGDEVFGGLGDVLPILVVKVELT